MRVLELLFRIPVVSVNQVSQRTGIKFTPSNLLVARFVEEGLLEEITGNKRNRLFRYRPYIDIFVGNT